MAWGALFVDNDGVPWATPDSTPMSLIKKIHLERSGAGSDEIDVDFSTPVIIAMHANSNRIIASISRFENGKTFVLSKPISGNFAYAIDVYVFSTKFQPTVKFGINIFDSQGRCIQTNETRVMPAPIRLGEPGTDGAGYNVMTYLAGEWAVIPAVTGHITAVIPIGGTAVPFQQPISSFACFDGINTQIYSGYWGLPGSQSTNITYHNTKDSVYVVDVTGF